jgi:hemoglobin
VAAGAAAIVTAPIYATLGGESGIAEITGELYKRLLDDEETRGYFDDVDMDRLEHHQRAFLTAAFGGPDGYSGRALRPAHAGLGITDVAFNTVATHLISILHERQVPADVVTNIGQSLSTLRPDVVEVEP